MIDNCKLFKNQSLLVNKQKIIAMVISRQVSISIPSAGLKQLCSLARQIITVIACRSEV